MLKEPLTNFSISNLAFAYEDVSTFIDSSPKSYFILLTAAFFASKLNLKYGWDFNGILIPSLLALQWYQPQRILLTFVEAWIVYYFGRRILKLKIFKQTNLEGAPKIIIFYSVSYIYKYLITLICLYFGFELKVTDYYAYGYLISTLIALKMHDKNMPYSLPRICIQASAVAAVVGVSIGFTFSKISNGLSAFSSTHMEFENKILQSTDKSFLENTVYLKSTVYKELYNPNNIQRDKVPFFIEIISKIYKNNFTKNDPKLNEHLKELLKLGYEAKFDSESFLYLTPSSPGIFFGSYIFNLNTSSKLIVNVPKTATEPLTFEAGAYIFKNLNAKAFFVHQIEDYTIAGKANQYFPRIKDILYKTNVDSNYLTIRSLDHFLSEFSNIQLESTGHSLVIARHRLPKNTELNILSDVDKDITLQWFDNESLVQKTDNSSEQKVSLDIGTAQVLLNEEALYKFAAKFLEEYESRTADRDKPLSINSLISENSLYISNEFDENFQKYSRGLTFLWDKEIFTELLNVKNKKNRYASQNTKKWKEYFRRKMLWLGYNAQFTKKNGADVVTLYRHLDSDHIPNFMGVYKFNLGPTKGYMVESPRPFYRNYTNEFAVNLYNSLPADFLMIAGSHPFSQQDESSNHWDKENPATTFTIAHQAVLREMQQSILPVQIRGYYHREGKRQEQKPIMMANLQGAWKLEQYDRLQEHLFKTINGRQDVVDIVDGKKETAGFENAETAQTPFSGQSQYRNYSLIWIPPYLKSIYGPKINSQAEIRKFTTYDVPAFYTDLSSYLDNYPITKAWKPKSQWSIKLLDYLNTRDVLSVQNLITSVKGLNFHIIRELESNHLILSVRRNSATLALINLTSGNKDKHILFKNDQSQSIRKFLYQQSLFLRREN